ncbi:hypothetical protein Y032_0015g2651 [Ancylostoma ceylanicum]|nr:hypothetical protein Y032_0015g2651 [Ancylostoma ceylanicum]
MCENRKWSTRDPVSIDLPKKWARHHCTHEKLLCAFLVCNLSHLQVVLVKRVSVCVITHFFPEKTKAQSQIQGQHRPA